ncbi:MAG TPA: hypothetical protein VG815_03160 [Chloroflexota bacterium]|nr:hypothetical protein [Chloroflexota bacterium]
MTVYPASNEVANLFHAHVGDPSAKTDPKWDSPSGVVYSWRWGLGRSKAAFYGTIVRKRPTFVAWSLLPAILRLVGDPRTADELFDFGVISSEAYRIAQALDGATDPLGTADIRKQAGFPTGKEHSSAYHKGLAELEHRLVVTSEFKQSDEDGTKHHGLIFVRYPEQVKAAEAMTREDAVDTFLAEYLPAARYAVPSVLARHMRVPEIEIAGGLERLCEKGVVGTVQPPGMKSSAYTLVEPNP